MDNVNKIKKLRTQVSGIRNLFKVLIPKWGADKAHYDKTGWGFNLDGRFQACSKIEIWFSSWCGVYGDSGCSSQLSLDPVVFQSHLIKYLNRNKETIMLEIADQIEEEARSLKDKAEEELNKHLDELKELDK